MVIVIVIIVMAVFSLFYCFLLTWCFLVFHASDWTPVVDYSGGQLLLLVFLRLQMCFYVILRNQTKKLRKTYLFAPSLPTFFGSNLHQRNLDQFLPPQLLPWASQISTKSYSDPSFHSPKLSWLISLSYLADQTSWVVKTSSVSLAANPSCFPLRKCQ